MNPRLQIELQIESASQQTDKKSPSSALQPRREKNPKKIHLGGLGPLQSKGAASDFQVKSGTNHEGEIYAGIDGYEAKISD